MRILRRIIEFYVEGFKSMTLGRTLWMLIFLKLIFILFLFLILKKVFFPPVTEGKSKFEQGEFVKKVLMREVAPNGNDTIKINNINLN